MTQSPRLYIILVFLEHSQLCVLVARSTKFFLVQVSCPLHELLFFPDPSVILLVYLLHEVLPCWGHRVLVAHFTNC